MSFIKGLNEKCGPLPSLVLLQRLAVMQAAAMSPRDISPDDVRRSCASIVEALCEHYGCPSEMEIE